MMPTPSPCWITALTSSQAREENIQMQRKAVCTQQDHVYRKCKTSIQNSDFYFFPKILIFYLSRRSKSKPQWDGSSLWPSHMSIILKARDGGDGLVNRELAPQACRPVFDPQHLKSCSWKNLLVIQVLSRYKQLTSAAPRPAHYSNSVSLGFQGDTLSQKTRWMALE